MAKIKSDGVILEVKFKSLEIEWINYDIKFYHEDDIIINDNILKREPMSWSKREFGTFLANDYEEDHLIEIIRKVLETNKPGCWEPIEPDAIIAIYPGRFFPFMETPYNLFADMEEMRIENEKLGKNHDLFTIIAFIDSYNFKNSSSYSGSGISLHIIVERKDLEIFANDLRIEYDSLISQFNIRTD